MPSTRNIRNILGSGISLPVSSFSDIMESKIRIPLANKPRLPMMIHKDNWGVVVDNPSMMPSFRGNPPSKGTPAIQNMERMILVDIIG
jgi:hypothetical protein